MSATSRDPQVFLMLEKNLTPAFLRNILNKKGEDPAKLRQSTKFRDATWLNGKTVPQGSPKFKRGDQGQLKRLTTCQSGNGTAQQGVQGIPPSTLHLLQSALTGMKK
ncbi:hypothetical protein niasHT_026051 [Heterodera trifolii]|uniref:Uncharacterized protein n=1 Tax=Heterodera trifolii TaxID=157864 RepID=A0ABD2KJU9_9BILA